MRTCANTCRSHPRMKYRCAVADVRNVLAAGVQRNMSSERLRRLLALQDGIDRRLQILTTPLAGSLRFRFRGRSNASSTQKTRRWSPQFAARSAQEEPLLRHVSRRQNPVLAPLSYTSIDASTCGRRIKSEGRIYIHGIYV